MNYACVFLPSLGNTNEWKDEWIDNVEKALRSGMTLVVVGMAQDVYTGEEPMLYQQPNHYLSPAGEKKERALSALTFDQAKLKAACKELNNPKKGYTIDSRKLPKEKDWMYQLKAHGPCLEPVILGKGQQWEVMFLNKYNIPYQCYAAKASQICRFTDEFFHKAAEEGKFEADRYCEYSLEIDYERFRAPCEMPRRGENDEEAEERMRSRMQGALAKERASNTSSEEEESSDEEESSED